MKYEFTLHPSGYDPNKPRFYVIGVGSLKDGVAIIKNMNEQFGDWCDNQDMPGDVNDRIFKLHGPADPTPIWLWEGADLIATSLAPADLKEYVYSMDNKWEKL